MDYWSTKWHKKKREKLELMLSMESLGISPSDSLVLMEYTEVAWFIKELQRVRKNEKTKKKLDFSEAVKMGNMGTMGKKGNEEYLKWYTNTFNKMLGGNKLDKKETGFSLLKKSNHKKKRSLLDRIRGK